VDRRHDIYLAGVAVQARPDEESSSPVLSDLDLAVCITDSASPDARSSPSLARTE